MAKVHLTFRVRQVKTKIPNLQTTPVFKLLQVSSLSINGICRKLLFVLELSKNGMPRYG